MGNLGKWPRKRHGTWENSRVMLAQRPAPPLPTGCPETLVSRRLWLLPVLLAAVLSGCASRGAGRDAASVPEGLEVRGRIALAAADIALSERHADGTTVVRGEWTAAARILFAQAAHEWLQRQGLVVIDHAPMTAAGESPLVERLLAAAGTRAGPTVQPADASMQEAVAPILRATGADYALFIRVRGSQASEGRAAVRAAGRLLLGGDIGGHVHEGAALLVELPSGRVVWQHQLSGANQDLRTLAGARSVVTALLAGLHGREAAPGR